MKKLLKKCKKKYIFTGIWICLGLLLIFEVKNIGIDMYNFKQLKHVKTILSETPVEEYNFKNLQEFNEQFWNNIEPIKNCYYISDENEEENYLFGFKLYSLSYKAINLKSHYAFPKYNLPERRICLWASCYDKNLEGLIVTISNPCRD